MKRMMSNAAVLGVGVIVVVGLASLNTASAVTTIRSNVALFQPCTVASGDWGLSDLTVMTDDLSATRVSTTAPLSGLWVNLGQEYTIEKLFLGYKTGSAVAGAKLYGCDDTQAPVGTPITVVSGTYWYYPTDWVGAQWIMISDEGTSPPAMTDSLRELRAFAQVPIYDKFIPYVVATASETYPNAIDLAPGSTCNNMGMTDQRTLVGDPAALSIASGPFWQTADDLTGWIKFDLGDTYDLSRMCIWNLNQLNHAIRGIQHATIEYSLDDVTYTALPDTNGEEAGNYTIPIVTENVQNACSLSIDLAALGINAAYVRITAHDNWGDLTNLGLSEVRFYGDVVVPVLIPGDTGPDGDVDDEDAAVVASYWGQTVTLGDYTKGDFNNDGLVNALDAALQVANWTSPLAEAAAVPEPVAATLLLSLFAAAAVARPRRRTR